MADYLSLSDLTLLERCRADDEKAWNTLFERYLPMAQKLASKVRHEYLEGQDLVAEGMIGLLSAVDRYRDGEGTSFSTYAYACMQNRMRNALRSVQGKGQIPPSMLLPIEEGYFQPQLSSVEETLVSEQEAKRIGEIIDSALSERERDVFLAFVHGSSYHQISAQTGLSRKGVDAALQRARKKLRQQLS
jgi:RNA polymerase sporulation-specific sigma factor